MSLKKSITIGVPVLISVIGILLFTAYISRGPVVLKSLVKSPSLKSTSFKSSYPISKQVKYKVTLHNNSSELITNSKFWIYAPVKETASQLVQSIKASHGYQLIIDKYNNQIMEFTFNEFAPFANKIITIQVSLNVSQQPNRQALNNEQEFLKPSEFIDLGNHQIVQLSEQLKQNKVEQTALKAFEWSINNIRYVGYRNREFSASEVLKTREGDCTEYMRIVTAINRSNHIPTREVGGFIVAQSRILKADEYHNWAEFYLDERWELSDPQNKIHQQSYENYIAFRHYGDDPQNPLNDAHRYKVSDTRIRAIMN